MHKFVYWYTPNELPKQPPELQSMIDKQLDLVTLEHKSFLIKKLSTTSTETRIKPCRYVCSVNK